MTICISVYFQFHKKYKLSYNNIHVEQWDGGGERQNCGCKRSRKSTGGGGKVARVNSFSGVENKEKLVKIWQDFFKEVGATNKWVGIENKKSVK